MQNRTGWPGLLTAINFDTWNEREITCDTAFGPDAALHDYSGFINSSTATFNGVDAVSLVSATQLTIALSSADISTAGTVPVVVTNPPPGGGSSPAALFTVQADNPVPSHHQPFALFHPCGDWAVDM